MHNQATVRKDLNNLLMNKQDMSRGDLDDLLLRVQTGSENRVRPPSDPYVLVLGWTSSAELFKRAVNDRMAQGYEPQGQTQVVSDRDGHFMLMLTLLMPLEQRAAMQTAALR